MSGQVPGESDCAGAARQFSGPFPAGHVVKEENRFFALTVAVKSTIERIIVKL